MKRFFFVALVALAFLPAPAQTPSGTYCFAHRDTCDLYLDVYDPAPGSATTLDSLPKPTVLFVFGGGFIMGSRRDGTYLPWYAKLTENGYRVVAIDYRLGLKGQRVRMDLFHLVEANDLAKRAVDIGVEDLFAAVRYLCDHPETGVDPARIVVSGCSAGAMIALSAVLETCNGSSRSAVLPPGFRFAGLMSFAGAVMTVSGPPAYRSVPCPQLLLHGTEDDTVSYTKMSFGRRGMYGRDALARIFKRNRFNYSIYRYAGHKHDIAIAMMPTLAEQLRFLEENVIRGRRLVIDATVDNPAITVFELPPMNRLYD